MNTNAIRNSLTAFVVGAAALAALPLFALAAPVEKVEGFVCPVLNETVGEHNPNAISIADGDYSLIPSGSPHTIAVPAHATNDDGAGSPGGSHAKPGDQSYTAIWGS